MSRAGAGGGKYVADTKLFDTCGSDPASVGVRGAYVGFGNTMPEARKLVNEWQAVVPLEAMNREPPPAEIEMHGMRPADE